MKLTPDLKKRIDEMPYQAMLAKWRFAPVGDPMFQGESGDYFAKVLSKKRDADPDLHVASSKTLGWR